MPHRKFGTWLSNKLIELSLKPADITRSSGIDSGVLSNIINNKRQQPSVETCKLLAKALAPYGVTLEEVYRAADILPEKPSIDTYSEAVATIMQDLENGYKEDLLDYARHLRQRAMAKEKHQVKTNPKAGARRTEPA